MDTQSSQSPQYVDYYYSANNSNTAMIRAQSTQATETTQRDMCLEDIIGWDDTAPDSNLPHTGPFTQPQYGGGSSASSHGSWGMDLTYDNFHPAENTPNTPHDHASHNTSSLCALVDKQPSQMKPSLSEPFKPLSFPPAASTSAPASTSPRPATTSPQEPADTETSHHRLSQDANRQLNTELRHDDILSFYTLALPHDNGTAHVFQLVGPKDMVPVVDCLPNGGCSVSWKKL
ncbi:uncharacterized protein PAC_02778 [Phialocephala subalpina]|uniref:Uncharacterized protein n=1 Tax=Phialocephala subalpina TaxID=576137 RepID=A0A1L7WJF7_9HELO|nr:uncharacterized protein PAC_02778 [Phialocephala subalpina]